MAEGGFCRGDLVRLPSMSLELDDLKEGIGIEISLKSLVPPSQYSPGS